MNSSGSLIRSHKTHSGASFFVGDNDDDTSGDDKLTIRQSTIQQGSKERRRSTTGISLRLSPHYERRNTHKEKYNSGDEGLGSANDYGEMEDEDEVDLSDNEDANGIDYDHEKDESEDMIDTDTSSSRVCLI